jgi:hypothetical protein
LDALRTKAYSLNGYVRATLERALSSPGDLNTEHLTKRQIERIEEAMNTVDLEVMVATVDAIVGRQRPKSLNKGRRAS